MPVRVQAVDQSVDLDPLDGLNGIESKGGVVLVGLNMQTGAEGVFAGGDMIPSERTVTVAPENGKLPSTVLLYGYGYSYFLLEGETRCMPLTL
tara:strand:- start:8090 stop:8368 length:279 start_codon:yes stop_codon:yes gene_type:complete